MVSFLTVKLCPLFLTLSTVLEEDDKAAVSAVLEANGIPMQAMDTMKPWMVSLQLGMMQIMQAGYDPQSGVETKSLDLGEEYLDTLVAEWADGDVKGIGAMMSNPAIFGTQDAYDALLTTRNKNWIPGIKALLDEPGNKLVAVGAGHLAGPDSVIGMLRDEGIKVKVVN